eukprot:CAMPEP_0184702002 /NCGR_PEP_ID=MMETSP0313-20130426/22384_1 /TAXON_ID=2792 /ORGANISM="Porphyridium aerugineum, Strain SAG 1380-2" /LENGTH=479 /DNA_ID=CAMNT_0027162289 /DNA_START=237 /DNA_END=1676 /DNA_ORIENTATION=-
MSKWDALCASVDGVATPTILAEKTQELSKMVGVTDTEIRLFLCLIAAYPIAFLWRALPSATIKHIYSVVLGWWMLQFVIGYQFLHIMIPCVLCYLAMAVVGPKARYLTMLIAFGYLTGGHIYRMYTDYLGWTLDWTMQMMVVVQKLSALGYNYYDGNSKHAKPDQKLRGIEKLPSPLEFFSFILFPANLVIGPSFEYTDYMAFANGTLNSPNPVLPALWRLVQGLALFVMNNAVMMYFPTWTLLNSKDFLTSGNIFTRYAQIWISLLGYRFKYYFGWKIAEGAGVMSGLGFNGINKETGKAKWNRLENIDVIGYETSQSLRDSASCWNKTTNLWLKYYFYERTPAPFNLYVTYFASAFWHGFYIGYYLFFLSVAFATQVHRNFRRIVRPLFMTPDGKHNGPYKIFYDAFCMVLTNLTTNYFIISFVVLAWENTYNAFKSLYFAGHIMLMLTYLIFGLGLIGGGGSSSKPAKKAGDAKTE